MSLMFIGVLIGLMGFGDSFGPAYGQTSGPTPTPTGAVLGVSKSADTDAPSPGTELTYTIVVRNTGDAPARSVTVEDTVPSALEIDDVTTSAGTATVSGQTVTVVIPELAAGASATVTIATTVREDAQGTVTNTVSVTAVDVNGQQIAEAEAGAAVVVGGGTASPSPSAAPSAAPSATPSAAPGVTPTPSGGPSQLPDTGGTTGDIEWSLLLVGMLLVAIGGLLFIRTRNAHQL
jgi:uncharacterized repeat protein (TIGR01451 family)